MKSFLQQNWGFSAYCAMLLIPSIYISGDGFAKALYPLIFFAVMIYHYRYFYFISLPFYCLCPFILYYEYIYSTPTDISVWLTILGSSSSEAYAYLEHVNWPILITLILIYLVLLPVFFKNISNKPFNMPFWLRILAFCLILSPTLRFAKANDSEQGYLDVYRHYKQSYPLNLILGFQAAQLEVEHVRSMVASQNKIHCSSSSNAPQTIVMVIGESARRDRLGLFGYTENPTTPYLEKRKNNLWLFDNMVSGSFMTSRSVPSILTGSLNTQAELKPSFINAFNASGYKTYWYSSQSKFGEFDSLVSAYASAAQEKNFSTQHSYSASLATHYDEELLASLDHALADQKNQQKLIVLHLYGSHAEFSKRYPASFAKFENDYDNTILYTDYILDQVIQKLEKSKYPASMLYTSDHGLNLGECPENPSAHLDIKSNYDVPMIMWASEAWKIKHPEYAQYLSKNLHQPLSSANILPTLLDMAGNSCPDIQPKQSMFSAHFKPETRDVITFEDTVNYDQAENDEECHLTANHTAKIES